MAVTQPTIGASTVNFQDILTAYTNGTISKTQAQAQIETRMQGFVSQGGQYTNAITLMQDLLGTPWAQMPEWGGIPGIQRPITTTTNPVTTGMTGTDVNRGEAIFNMEGDPSGQWQRYLSSRPQLTGAAQGAMQSRFAPTYTSWLLNPRAQYNEAGDRADTFWDYLRGSNPIMGTNAVRDRLLSLAQEGNQAKPSSMFNTLFNAGPGEQPAAYDALLKQRLAAANPIFRAGMQQAAERNFNRGVAENPDRPFWQELLNNAGSLFKF